MSFLITFAVKVKSTTVQGSRNHPRENVKANLVIGNIPVANGVVHLIDKPLIIVASPLWDYLQEEVRERPLMTSDFRVGRGFIMTQKKPDVLGLKRVGTR